jgi:IS30 family transposase
MPYLQFTYFDRCEIQCGLRHGLSCRAIAKDLGRSPSSLCREVRRNRDANGTYDALRAQYKYVQRPQQTGAPRKMEYLPLRAYVEEKLIEDWEPMCIATMLPLDFPEDEGMRVSHETIYQFVYADKRNGGDLHTHLRRRHKQRWKRGDGKRGRGGIKNRISIEERPVIVDVQERTGDWEGDTVIGLAHKRPLATFAERRTLYVTAAFMDDKSADSLNRSAIEAFAHLPSDLMHTLTVDNGTEFAGHQSLAQDLNMDICFALPNTPSMRRQCQIHCPTWRANDFAYCCVVK